MVPDTRWIIIYRKLFSKNCIELTKIEKKRLANGQLKKYCMAFEKTKNKWKRDWGGLIHNLFEKGFVKIIFRPCRK